jgi:hypothetical protein
LRKNSLIRFGLGGAVLVFLSLFLRDRRVGVNLPAPNRDGNLDLVDSAITQCHLKQQVAVEHKNYQKHNPEQGHADDENIGVVPGVITTVRSRSSRDVVHTIIHLDLRV